MSHLHYRQAHFYLPLVVFLFVVLPFVVFLFVVLPFVVFLFVVLPFVVLPFVVLPFVVLPFVVLPFVVPSLTVSVSILFGVLVEEEDSWYTVACIFQYSTQLSVAGNWEER